MMCAKVAIDKGTSPWTGTFLGNLWLAIIWFAIAAWRGEVVAVEAWGQAAVVGLLFVLGQVFTYLAFQFGDVSVATPIFSVKVLMVAGLSSFTSGTPVPGHVWFAGCLATCGVILIQWSDKSSSPAAKKNSRTLLTVSLALTAAFCLSLFDVCLQKWGPEWNSFSFLPIMFGAALLLSFFFLPFVNRPEAIRKTGGMRWIVAGTMLMAMQAMSMCFSLAHFGDAPRINIVYSLRGLWGVLFAWMMAKRLQSGEVGLPRATMIRRLIGAVLLLVAVIRVILN